MVYDRTIEGRELDFGAIGLEEGVFFLYDSETHSWWSQIRGRAVRGPLEGQELRKHPSTLTTWGRWRALHPQTTVFADPRLPGRRRFTEETFSRITLSGDAGGIVDEDLVIGVERPGAARAWLLRHLAPLRLANDRVDGEPLVVYLARDAVTTQVWRREVAERTLTFAAEGDRVRDEETGSLWDPLTGRAIAGPLEGERLEPVPFTLALWYAWRSQRPDTSLWTAPAP